MNAAAPAALAATAEHFLSRAETLPQSAARRRAADTFRAGGLPTPREEAWHYTPLRALAGVPFAQAHAQGDAALVPDLDTPRLVFVGGRFDAALSRLPERIGVATGAPAFGSLAHPESERIVALNAMLAEDGAAIAVPAGCDGGTLLLVSLGSDAQGRPTSCHPRHAVTLGAGARLTLLEVFAGTGTYLNNPVLEASIAEDATLTHVRLQAEAPGAFHLSTLYADIDARGTYDSFALAAGGRLARMEVHARLGGAGASVHLNAAQLLGGARHADFTTVIRHDAPACASRQTVKTVLMGRSHGVFQGKIEVARVAQKTDGYQMNQSLLLSPDAEMDSKPQLEIYADDVKCSHGATTGALDDDQLFYLRSRGVPLPDAQKILVRAFLAEALDPIAHEGGRALLEGAVARWWETQA